MQELESLSNPKRGESGLQGPHVSRQGNLGRSTHLLAQKKQRKWNDSLDWVLTPRQSILGRTSFDSRAERVDRYAAGQGNSILCAEHTLQPSYGSRMRRMRLREDIFEVQDSSEECRRFSRERREAGGLL